MKVLRIPKHTTGHLQPLDVVWNRQLKIFVKRVAQQACHQNETRVITSRGGILNLYSLIWNQMGSHAYRDTNLYGWRHTDPDFRYDEMTSTAQPPNVHAIQFHGVSGHTYQHSNCTAPAFIRCSYCHRMLCLHHFLDRTCFHPNRNHGHGEHNEHGVITDDEEDDLFDLIVNNTVSTPSPISTTSSPDPPPEMGIGEFISALLNPSRLVEAGNPQR